MSVAVEVLSLSLLKGGERGDEEGRNDNWGTDPRGGEGRGEWSPSLDALPPLHFIPFERTLLSLSLHECQSLLFTSLHLSGTDLLSR